MNNKDLAIKVEHISKCYRIGFKEQMHDNLCGTLLNFMKSPFKNFRTHRSLYKFDDVNFDQSDDRSDILWALKDVSFDIQKGEVVGIIGLNGAGKSTLLKVLSKITVPTSGRIGIRGRVSSLLEVGTGFHPELTGRENVYLNGTILGMRKNEIDQKFDEIVDFSGVEKFLETPVKRYSSGMRVRLAFAVAAHLEPEILLVDEVLAVGDAQFQKKCIEKMQDVGRNGRTVLFVSHSMPAVTRLCPRVILLNGGRVEIDDVSHRVVSAYLQAGKATKGERIWPEPLEAPGDEVVRLSSVRVRTRDKLVTEAVDISGPVGLEIEYLVLQNGYEFKIYFHLINEEGIEVFTSLDNDQAWRKRIRPPGRYVSTAWIPGNLLSEGMHFVGAGIRTLNPELKRFSVNEIVGMQVVDSMDGQGARVDFTGDFPGIIRPLLKWETQVTPMEPSSVVGSVTTDKGMKS